MLKQFIALIIASSSPIHKESEENFVLCNSNPHNSFVISVDYNRIVGIYEDYGTTITSCGSGASGCIDYPFVISIPPRMPSTDRTVLNWSVGGYRFSVAKVRGRSGEYLITAAGRRPNGVQIGTLIYTYEASVGVTSYRRVGINEIWRRCAGNLTFDQLRNIRRRIPIGG